MSNDQLQKFKQVNDIIYNTRADKHKTVFFDLWEKFPKRS